jgi:uncharacterized LabA/DUF88 family protein
MYEGLYDQAVIVSGDGDFACLVNFLKEKKRLKVLLSPNSKKASVLLRRTVPESIVFLERFQDRLGYAVEKNAGEKRKSPAAGQNPHGSSFMVIT